ncbi:NAD(P)-binding protein [Mycena albidolilacea]|uniref:NAD(P)-binding protein n=1 Tax=Mycena albidolilacea TaxID=1033008 RepID=A0AAD7A9G4_9AGAR|nr:NAD(P)-binding protein [Mycena albidolilacea]
MAPKDLNYDITRRETLIDPSEFYQQTVTRLEQIKAHVEEKTGNCLKGKVCIVTGAESLKGIGRATVMIYAREGAQHIYVLDKSTQNLPNLQSTVQSKYPGVKITCIGGDAADEAAIKALCARALVEEGRLDVFFANAGVATTTRLQDADPDVFMRTMRINTLSCMLAIKHASAAMMKTNPGKTLSGGSIILTASTAGIRSGAGPLDYSASKAAVNSLAQTGASQLANTNVRVNSICPDLTETGMTESAFEYARNRGTIGKVGQLNPLGRFAIAEEIAQVALFFASDQSSYVNGQTLAVDGGHSASLPVMPGRWM